MYSMYLIIFTKLVKSKSRLLFVFQVILVHDGLTAHQKNLQWQHTLERCKNIFYVILVTAHLKNLQCQYTLERCKNNHSKYYVIVVLNLLETFENKKIWNIICDIYSMSSSNHRILIKFSNLDLISFSMDTDRHS
jgi:hypothetical protein